MTPVVRNVGLILLIPLLVNLAYYTPYLFAGNEMSFSGTLLLFGGPLSALAYLVTFPAVGYQLSKHRTGTALTAGVLCALAFLVFAPILGRIMMWIFAGFLLPIELSLAATFPIFMPVVAAFGLGAIGFVVHALKSISAA
jgi:hypothetical protein